MLRRSPLTALLAALLSLSFATAAAPASGDPGSGHGHRHRHGHEHGKHHGKGHHHPRGTCTDAPALLFCEDFESLPPGEAGSPHWETDTENGTLTVEPHPAGHRAGKHLRVRTEGNGKAFLTVTDLAPPGNSFWGRVRLRVAAFPTAPDWAHWTMVEATGRGPGYIRPLGGQYVPSAGKNLWGVGSDGGPTGDWTAWQESAPARAGSWSCVEWRMDASDNRIEVWFDGEPQPDLTVDTRNHGGAEVDFVFPEFDTVKFGWQLYQGDPSPSGYDVRMDDLALGTERVGCER
ncbi:hypothetical protein [Streptomyces sp. S07_1.15]|uniref:hypothetical protein n=1 Tax=Streptomyces sp. S07_1.15 TaxID=2873925 RepID=UPI0027E1C3BD|nr:hypothetical protein [Streptomyces sp. S07_1.15]